MLLGVEERLVLLSVLPTEGNFTTIKLMRDLREKLSFSEEEHKEYNFRFDNDGKERMIQWDNGTEKEITIGEKQADMIKDALKKLNDTNKLQERHFSIYEKFMGS